MPVILHRDMEEFWLDTSIDEAGALGEALTPYPAQNMEACEASTLGNSAANDKPEGVVRLT